MLYLRFSCDTELQPQQEPLLSGEEEGEEEEEGMRLYSDAELNGKKRREERSSDRGEGYELTPPRHTPALRSNPLLQKPPSTGKYKAKL